MNKVLKQLVDFFKENDLENLHPNLPLIFVAAISVLALLLALIAVRKSSTRSPAANVRRLKQTFAELKLELNSVSSENTRLRGDLEPLIHRLQSKVGELELLMEQEAFRTDLPDSVDRAGELDALESQKVEKQVAGKGNIESTSVTDGLTKTRKGFLDKLGSLFKSSSKLDNEQFKELEDILISSDIGVSTSKFLVEKVRERLKSSEDSVDAKSALKDEIGDILIGTENPEAPNDIYAKPQNGPCVVMVVGVNGVGKTTTIAKLALNLKDSGKSVLLAACDTFRAAAEEQLQVWADRAKVEVVIGAPKAKPATVAYQGVNRAKDEQYDVLIVDTAGRLHTSVNLMKELASVKGMLARECPEAPHQTYLVLDASTGQNALQQAREFNKAVSLDGIIVTKLDGTAKGGIIIAIANELKLPIRYIGVGEGIHDLKPFDVHQFTEALFEDSSEVKDEIPGEHARMRKRRQQRIDEIPA